MPDSEEVTRLQEQTKTLFANFDGLKAEVKEIRDDVKELRDHLANRLPNWATIAIAMLTAMVGWFAGH